MPTLHWTAYYDFTNPLCLPLANTHDNIEKNKNMLYRLTTTLTPRQFTYVGYIHHINSSYNRNRNYSHNRNRSYSNNRNQSYSNNRSGNSS